MTQVCVALSIVAAAAVATAILAVATAAATVAVNVSLVVSLPTLTTILSAASFAGVAMETRVAMETPQPIRRSS